jgi:hypothetical protein
MKRLILASTLILMPLVAYGQQQLFSKPLGHCQLTSMASSTLVSTCTGGIPATTNYIVIQVQTAAIMWRDDGVEPTASVGNLAPAGSWVPFQGDATNLRVIAVTGSPVVDFDFRHNGER